VSFIQSNLPFYLLHSFISLFVCFVVLRYMDDRTQGRWTTASTILLLVAGVASAAIFYAAALVQHSFKVPFGPNGADLAVLMVVINVLAAVMAFACAAFCKRQAETSPNGPQRQDLSRSPVMEFAGVHVDAPLAPAVPPGE
jgi:glucan phosphoethanolaminetransferase (alkaline phosphatase superfamily)